MKHRPTSSHTKKTEVRLVRQPNFSKIEARVADAERKRRALEEMLVVLGSTKNFDKEDERSVEELLMTVLHEERTCIQDLVSRRKIYEETLREAQMQIQERNDAMSHINDTSEAFALFPELAQKFAKRQAIMIQRVSEATQQLEDA